jgi:Acetyltransferases, including N-acetylases of ribosomal proteins
MPNVKPEPSTWSLRPARPSDARTLAEIVCDATKDQGRWPVMKASEEAEWLDGYTQWSEQTADGTDALQVIEQRGQVIGRLRIERDQLQLDGQPVPRITLCGLQLRPTVQRRGIGSSIVQFLQDSVTRADGVLDLGVEHDNPGARRLYERLGFRPNGQDTEELHMRWLPKGLTRERAAGL